MHLWKKQRKIETRLEERETERKRYDAKVLKFIVSKPVLQQIKTQRWLKVKVRDNVKDKEQRKGTERS